MCLHMVSINVVGHLIFETFFMLSLSFYDVLTEQDSFDDARVGGCS